MKAWLIEWSGEYGLTSITLHVACECGKSFFVEARPEEPFKCPYCGRKYRFQLEFKLKKMPRREAKEFESLRGRKIKVGLKPEEFYKSER